MNTKLTAAKKFAQDHKTQIAAAAGVAVGAAAMLAYIDRKTLLEVTAADARRMKAEPGCAMYDTKFGQVFVTMTTDF